MHIYGKTITQTLAAILASFACIGKLDNAPLTACPA
jgi:hypothetical protein